VAAAGLTPLADMSGDRMDELTREVAT